MITVQLEHMRNAVHAVVLNCFRCLHGGPPLRPQASVADAEAVEAFYGPKETPGIERTVAQAAEAIRARAARLERDADSVAAWLTARSA